MDEKSPELPATLVCNHAAILPSKDSRVIQPHPLNMQLLFQDPPIRRYSFHKLKLWSCPSDLETLEIAILTEISFSFLFRSHLQLVLVFSHHE